MERNNHRGDVFTTGNRRVAAGPERARDGQSEDVLFEILRNDRRRSVVRYLDRERTATTGELAEHVAASEHGIDEAALRSDQRKGVYISLYQSHLPKLRDAGVVEYDRQRGRVVATPALAEYVDVLDRFESARSERRVLADSLTGVDLPVCVVAAALGAALSAVSAGFGWVSAAADTALATALLVAGCALIAADLW